jgi:hypothetical protein
MEKQLSKKLKVVEQGNDVKIEFKDPTGVLKDIRFGTGGISLSTNAILTTAMPLAYSSGFQTATLSNTFQQTGLLAFANIVGYSFTSTVNGASTTIAIKTA